MKTRNKKSKRWSAKATAKSNALSLEKNVFTFNDPKKIASSLKNSAEKSIRRKSPPFRSAMSMLNFYINRAGKNLSPDRKNILNKAKVKLRKIYGRNNYGQ